MKTRTIRILKTNKENVSHCYECDDHAEIIRGITKWDIVSEAEYGRIDEAVRNANMYRAGKWHYFIVQEHMMPDIEEIFDTAKQFSEWMERLKKQSDAEEREAKERRQAASLARKQKQLDKLRAELEEEKK